MIDFSDIERYKENNRIEAKKALGGLPKSIWETYSAFANTMGGVILLGVEEYKDKSLHPVDLPDPEKMVREFWDIINNSGKVSVNILSEKNVTIYGINGKHIIGITVPRAQRYDKPVFIDNNPFTGTYRRNGEGDYRCFREEVQAMMRDANVKTQDMAVLENMGLDVFDYDSIHHYRICMKKQCPGHVWEKLEDTEFLHKLGAVDKGETGELHPTAAGLLMFGYEPEIRKEYPDFFLDYQEQLEMDASCTDRIVSMADDWSGNIFDFYCGVYHKLVGDVKIPFRMEMGEREDETPVHCALREALLNCIINADYYGLGGIVIMKKGKKITMSNPGGFRIDIEAAKSGGVSDPRNAALIKMFNHINISECIGSGIPNIYNTWKQQGWSEPLITESFSPERITLSLMMEKSKRTRRVVKIDNKKVAIKKAAQKNAIIEYLTLNVSAKSSELAAFLELKPSIIKGILKELVKEDIIVAEGNNKDKVYKLKA